MLRITLTLWYYGGMTETRNINKKANAASSRQTTKKKETKFKELKHLAKFGDGSALLEIKNAYEKKEINEEEKVKLLMILIEKLEDQNKELEKRVDIDELTGFSKRRPTHSLEKLIAQLSFKGKRTISGEAPLKAVLVIAIDLDNFKFINDTYGHGEGDRSLVVFAKHLREAVQGTDLIFRPGGDEFVVIFPVRNTEDVSDEVFAKLIMRIQSRANTELVKETKKLKMKAKLAASIGYAVLRVGEKSMKAEELLDIADKRMYENKKSRKGGVFKFLKNFRF